ncbi:unnamed protein product [Rotaria magnacalcarata]|uniref:Centrosomin N-terminal motif 1 domain-containing protein n=1 Tax=Rotaria magnacalcarata TaxID=392030 RepID=A0A816ZRP8_9BILA|nr:unnamed protein product [Rotaria magnacalcarata]
MSDTNGEIISSHKSEENPLTSPNISNIGTNLVKTIRDYDNEFQDLKRENFNLKLRIYFLEEQSQYNFNNNEYPNQTSYVQQLQNDTERLHRRTQSQSEQIDNIKTVYHFDYDDERRALREELEKFRQENAFLRKSFQLNSNTIHDNEQEILTINIPTQIIQTSTLIDSGFDATSSGMSNTFISSSALQIELNEYKERERKLQEQVNSLRKQLDSTLPQTNEALAELDRARRQIRQYEVDIQNYEQQQSKSERVLQRLQTDYETRIANLVGKQQQQLADFESYRHEPLLARIRFSYPLPEQTDSSLNIEEYRLAIHDRDRIIQQLEEAINEITIRLRTPFTLMLPSQSSTAESIDEHSQKLIAELNSQMQIHLETVDQLRAECVELRRSEKILRNQVDSLTQLIHTPMRNLGLPPIILPSPLSTKTVDIIEEAQQVEDLQTAVVQITLQLQSDAENVSGLTNRVAQIIRDRDEWQDRINRLQDEVEKKNAHIRQLEEREPEVERRIRQQYVLQIEILQREIKDFNEKLQDRDRLLNEINKEKKEIELRKLKEYEKFDQIHNQERQNLQGQLRTANENFRNLEEQWTVERRQHDDLQMKYEQLRASTETQVGQWESEIQQQKKYIENFNLEIHEMETKFKNDRRQFERDIDSEKEKNVEIQNKLHITHQHFTDLQTEYDRFKLIVDEQRNKHEQQIRTYQSQMVLFDQEKLHINDEIESLKRENQSIKTRYRDVDNKILELTTRNDGLKSKISIYEIRLHDNEDNDKRSQNEIAKLKRDIQQISQENEDRIHEINEWRRKCETLNIDLNRAQYERQILESEHQTMNNENIKLKDDLDELTIRIRLDIEKKYDDEYRQFNSRTETEIRNLQKDKEAMQHDLDQSNKERTRLFDRLQVVERNVKQANETLKIYAVDIDRLRIALSISQEENKQLEREISKGYAEDLKLKTDRLQDLENKCRLTEIQFNQYETKIRDLRQENTKLIESNEHIQRQYNQYRIEQQANNDSRQKTSTEFEERGRKELVQANKNKEELINTLERKLLEKDNIIKELQHAQYSYEPKDLQLDFEIRIESLEQEAATGERFTEVYSESIPIRNQQADRFLNSIQYGNSNNTSRSEILRQECQIRDQKSEQLLNEKKLIIVENERHISELQTVIRDQEREINNANAKLQQIQQSLNTQQHELDNCRQKRDILTVDLNIAIEENEAHLDRIRALERQLEMTQTRNITPEQIAHYQGIIEDLKAQLRHREDSIQNLQRTIDDSDRTLKETRQSHNTVQSDYNRTQLHYEQMENQYKADLEDRDQTIVSLRKKLVAKDDEIDKLRQSDIAKEVVINKLRSKSRESDQDSRSEYSGARAPANVVLKLELQKKDDLIDELKRQLDRTRSGKTPSGRVDSSTVQYAQRVEVQRRPRSMNFDHLNREELLYELEMALQDNEGLVQQLAKKTPNITELHNQLLDVRKELARQKYVNQVLWRKLDALLDIQGSNTRAELTLELANYHDELEALKAKQSRSNNTRTAVLNAISRSSSGLIESSSIRQRRHSAEDTDRKTSSLINIIKSHDKITDDTNHSKSTDELREIIRNQKKYIEQLQKRVRLHVPYIIQPAVLQKLTEQNKNLNLVINTYKNESNLLKNELKKFYKANKLKQLQLEQRQNIIKQQQSRVEESIKSSNQHAPIPKKHEQHQIIFYEEKPHATDDLIIDVNINISQEFDKTKKTSLNKKDSGVESVMDSTRCTITQQEHQRQMSDKDDQIRQITKELNDVKKTYEYELNQYRLNSEKVHTDLIDDLNTKQNDLRQLRVQVDLLKSTKTQLDQAQDQNQRLHGEIKLLYNEINSKKDLIDHYEKQISLLEKQISHRDGGKGEMTIRTSEMSELLEEMRRLRHDLERSIQKQNELQAKLDENIRVNQTKREFTFSGHGVSYPDLRIIDASGSVGAESISFTSITDEKRARPVGSSTTELVLGKMYIVGELENHENLRRLMADIKIELNALEVKMKEKLRSKFTSSITEPSIEWLEHRLNSLNQCLIHFEQAYQFIESYWKAYLPVKNSYDEHPFNDPRLVNENKELRISQSKYMQELQSLRQKYKEQSVYMDQVLSQLTKANHKKANTDDYLAFLLRPTLDVLQKARSNMEHHLKEPSKSK